MAGNDNYINVKRNNEFYSNSGSSSGEHNDPTYKRPKKTAKVVKIAAATATVGTAGATLGAKVNSQLTGSILQAKYEPYSVYVEVEVKDVQENNIVYLHYENQLTEESKELLVLEFDSKEENVYFTTINFSIDSIDVNYETKYYIYVGLTADAGLENIIDLDSKLINFTVEEPI